MWLQALTRIKTLPEGKNAKPVVLDETSPPFELDDDAGAELVAGGAAKEVPAPAAPAAPVTGAKAAAATK